MKRLGLVAAAWLAASSASAQEAVQSQSVMSQPRDWAQTLREDATAVHSALIDSHPGTHDPLNPDFRKQIDQGLAQALARAEHTTDAGGWWWALREYIASFNDGHVSIFLKDQGFQFDTLWPGFLTRFVGDDQLVAATDEANSNLPPLGAKLVECDGISAGDLAAKRVGQFRGRWFLKAMHVRVGDQLFQDHQNPWTDKPSSCRFAVGEEVLEYALVWKPEDDTLKAQRAQLQSTPRAFGVEGLPDGGYWISTPGFDGSPQSSTYPQLMSVIESMKNQQFELRAAPYIVFDLRGNGGGSSNWSRQMALALWGESWLEVHRPRPSEGVDWRASKANWSALDAFAGELRAAQGNAEALGYLDTIVKGIRSAEEGGEVFWREKLGGPAILDEEVAPAPIQQVMGKVYVLTDSMCASACLDAVDAWKAAGAIQIGRETSADTVYMDTRTEQLPSGLALLAVPMKVYRGRARGNNEPHHPTHILPVETMDDSALQAAVLQIHAN